MIRFFRNFIFKSTKINLLCKYFGHRWNYYIIPDSTRRYIKVCKRCLACLEFTDRYHTPNGFSVGWYTLVQLTKKGAKELIKELI